VKATVCSAVTGRLVLKQKTCQLLPSGGKFRATASPPRKFEAIMGRALFRSQSSSVGDGSQFDEDQSASMQPVIIDSPPTAKQLAFVKLLAERMGVEVPVQAYNSKSECSRVISWLKEESDMKLSQSRSQNYQSHPLSSNEDPAIKTNRDDNDVGEILEPTPRQLQYAQTLSLQTGIPLPREAMVQRDTMSRWIDNAVAVKRRRSQGTLFSNPQNVGIQSLISSLSSDESSGKPSVQNLLKSVYFAQKHQEGIPAAVLQTDEACQAFLQQFEKKSPSSAEIDRKPMESDWGTAGTAQGGNEVSAVEETIHMEDEVLEVIYSISQTKGEQNGVTVDDIIRQLHETYEVEVKPRQVHEWLDGLLGKGLVSCTDEEYFLVS